MGAAFAIQVKTGKEEFVKGLLDWSFERNVLALKWVRGVHTFVQGTKRLGKNKLGKCIKRAQFPGYVFIEMNNSTDGFNTSAYLPPELWHMIKEVPCVLKLLGDAGQLIGEEEFAQLYEKVDLEEQVETSIELPESNEVRIVEEKEKAVNEAMHEMNVASTKDDMQEASLKLDKAIAEVDAMKEAPYQPETGPIEKLKSKHHGIKTFLKNKKEIIRFPKSLFEDMKKSIDPGNNIPVNLLNSSSSFLPFFIDFLKGEVMIN